MKKTNNDIEAELEREIQQQRKKRESRVHRAVNPARV